MPWLSLNPTRIVRVPTHWRACLSSRTQHATRPFGRRRVAPPAHLRLQERRRCMSIMRDPACTEPNRTTSGRSTNFASRSTQRRAAPARGSINPLERRRRLIVYLANATVPERPPASVANPIAQETHWSKRHQVQADWLPRQSGELCPGCEREYRQCHSWICRPTHLSGVAPAEDRSSAREYRSDSRPV